MLPFNHADPDHGARPVAATTPGQDTAPWFNLQQTFHPPAIDPAVADQTESFLYGCLYGLRLATVLDPKLKASLTVTANNYDAQSTEEMLKSWDLEPSLIPPGVDPKDVKQQFNDIGLIDGVTQAAIKTTDGLGSTSIIRKAMLAQVTKEGVDIAKAAVKAELDSGGQTTAATKATARLMERLAELAQEAATRAKGKQKAHAQGAQNYQDVSASHDAIAKQSEAQKARIVQLEQVLAQSGLTIPPIVVDGHAEGIPVGLPATPVNKPAHHVNKPAPATPPKGGQRKPSPSTSRKLPR